MPEPADRWREAVSTIQTWKRGDERAVHKPLLTLLLIADAHRGGAGKLAFRTIETQLSALLREFGRPSTSYHPEYPFWHLQSDPYWEVQDADTYSLRKAGRSPPVTELRTRDAVGQVPAPMWEVLKSDRALQRELATAILDEYWPPSLHGSIREAVGLPDTWQETRAKRDPRFRENVLRAYERRCAICGFDGRLANDTFALEAAHVQWHCYEGPDEVENGIALCSLHHVAFDTGAIGLTREHRITVSMDVNGSEAVDELVLRYVDAPLRGPQGGAPRPAPERVGWHTREVFRGPPRVSA